MCEACAGKISLESSGKRRRLWEMNDGWHCSIIGTCLTLADLRALGRKLDLQVRTGFPEDYQLHGYFVAEASKNDVGGKMLGKLLDKRHAVAVRRARQLKSEDDVRVFWEESLQRADIPGPYWALLCHPASCQKFCERMFADVHMLSHLVGASNRADIRRLQALEDENDLLRDRIRRICSRHRERLRTRDERLNEMAHDLTVMRADHGPAQVLHLGTLGNGDERLAAANAHVNEAERAMQAQTKQIADLTAELRALKDENRVLERELSLGEGAADMGQSLDLNDRRILYVGGRKPAIARLRAAVEGWQGEFLHHDGGLEQSSGELAAAIARADTVVFPVDCVSHEAVLKVKKLCRQGMKPYVPLRSCGLGSLVAGLRHHEGDAQPMLAAE